jgi:MFS family permease
MERFHRNAALLWSGQFASQMGHSVFEGALAWLALSLTGSGLAAGTGIFLSTVPFLLVGPFAGAWVDRVDRRAVLVGSDVARGLVLLALPFLVTPGPRASRGSPRAPSSSAARRRRSSRRATRSSPCSRKGVRSSA